MSEGFWINAQYHYDLEVAKDSGGENRESSQAARHDALKLLDFFPPRDPRSGGVETLAD